ncbi:unnamed protein product, partial [Ectocarpus sp. 12 AP-2014]
PWRSSEPSRRTLNSRWRQSSTSCTRRRSWHRRRSSSHRLPAIGCRVGRRRKRRRHRGRFQRWHHNGTRGERGTPPWRTRLHRSSSSSSNSSRWRTATAVPLPLPRPTDQQEATRWSLAAVTVVVPTAARKARRNRPPPRYKKTPVRRQSSPPDDDLGAA